MREDLIQSAVSFLTDPKVQSAPLAKKLSFLESKGMTSEEVEEAISRSNGNAPAATITAAASPALVPPAGAFVPYNNVAPPVPVRPSYDWRDVFIAAVLAGGSTYGIWMLAKRFFSPWFKVPLKEELEKDAASLDTQFDAVEASLREIKDQTEEALTAVSTQSDRINTSLTSLEAALEDLKNGDDARQVQSKEIQNEVDALKELVPKMMDRNNQEQGQVLEELQNELKSLKGLLLGRRPISSSIVPELTPGNGVTSTLASVSSPPNTAATLKSGSTNGSSTHVSKAATTASSEASTSSAIAIDQPNPSEPATAPSSSSAAGSVNNVA